MLLKIEPVFQERVWGTHDLSPLYTVPPGETRRIGEVWMTGDDNRIANGPWAGEKLGDAARKHGPVFLGQPVGGSSPSGFPILVKFLFTSDKLSVQVHPPDFYANAREQSAGKTEMWHVIGAQPGAQLAIGFKDAMPGAAAGGDSHWDRAKLREAVESGAIESMLNWTAVQPGDTYFIPAGTVHAIGPGLTLCEIQQNSDITYRLYDYNRPGTDGRPRPLHVEQALDVLTWRSQGGRTRPLNFQNGSSGRTCLAACSYFAAEAWTLAETRTHSTCGRFEIFVVLRGEAAFEAAGDAAESIVCRAGEVVIVPAEVRSVTIQPRPECGLIRAFCPDLDKDVIEPLLSRGVSEEDMRETCFR